MSKQPKEFNETQPSQHPHAKTHPKKQPVTAPQKESTKPLLPKPEKIKFDPPSFDYDEENA